MTKEKKNNPRSQSSMTSFPVPETFREQAEQKAGAIALPDLDTMTHEEIRHLIYEMKVKQVEADLQIEHLRSGLETNNDQASLFRIITENMLDMVAVTDMAGNFTFTGKSHEVLGYEPGFLIGKNVMDFVHPEDLPCILDEFAEFVASGHPRRVEYRNKCKDGTYLWFETVGNFIADEKDIPQKIIFTSRDTTEHRIADRQLRESKEEAVQKERLYRLLFEQSPLGVFHVDENGVIVSCNDIFVKIIGSSREALVGLDMKKLPDQKLVRQLRKALAGSHAFYKDTYHSVTAKKSTPVKVYFSPLIIEDGTLVGCTGIVEDITEQKRSEEALRQSETYYRAIFETSGSAMLIIEHDTIISGININFEKMFGYPKLEVEGKKSWTELVHPDDMEWMTKYHYLRRRAPGEAARNYEFRFFTRNGDLRNGYLSVDMISGTKRSVVSIVDITDRKQAEEAVRQSEALHSKMVANIGEVIVIIDENGINRYKSGNVEKHFGWKPEELVGALTWENVHPDDVPPVRRLFADIIKSPGRVGAIECRYRCKDGTYKWIEFTGSNLLDDPDIHGLLGNYKDISERKKAEKALLESEQTFRALFEKGPIGVAYHRMVYDSLGNPVDYRFLAANQSYQKLTGVDPTGKLVTEAFPGIENDPFGWIGTFGKVARTGQEIRFQQHLQHNDRWYDCVGYQYKPDHFVAAFFEITEQKRAEAEREKLQHQLNQAQKMESVGRLAGGVAHDFNNKLAIINGYAEMAADMIDPSDPLRETIQEIHTAGQQSADIVRQLLAFARKQTISPVQLDLNDTISGMLKMLQRLIGENIDLTWHPGRNLWPVKIDPSQIDQIMANLAVNSRDAISDVGKLIIETKNTIIGKDHCETNPETIPGRYVMLAVSDDGHGIEKEVQERMFDPYFTTKEIGKGTGLGLPTIYGIVKQNNGFINVYSEPGEGTTFKLYFPPCETEKSSVYTPKESSGQMPTGTETILLVEDEPAIVKMGREMLERLGYNVLSAERPDDAVRLAAEHDGKIDLLITDVVMPEMNGRDLASQLNMSQPKVKTLYMSGYTADVIDHHGVLDEKVLFIQKPFSMKDLAVKIREVLEWE